MIEVTPQTIMDFTKLLIECGDVYEVQPDYTIKNKMTGETVQIVQGKQPKPLMIFHEGASCLNDVAWLNPFKENLGVSRERDWFFGVITTIGGVLTRYIMLKLIDDGVKKVDDNYDQFELMSKISSKVDEQMVNEVTKIGSSAFIRVCYNKKDKSAEAQTDLFGKEIHDAFPKFRKKTWEVIETIFEEIYGSTDLGDYKYRAKLINIPETEAKLAVSIAILKAVGPYARDILGKDLHENELEQHMEVLEGYSRLYAWAPVNQEVSNKQAQQTSTPPWATQNSIVPLPTGNVPIPVTATGPSMLPFGQSMGMGVPVTSELYPTPFASGSSMYHDSASGIFGMPYR